MYSYHTVVDLYSNADFSNVFGRKFARIGCRIDIDEEYIHYEFDENTTRGICFPIEVRRGKIEKINFCRYE